MRACTTARPAARPAAGLLRLQPRAPNPALWRAYRRSRRPAPEPAEEEEPDENAGLVSPRTKPRGTYDV